MNKKLKLNNSNEVILYDNSIQVQLKLDTIWLTQAQIAELFGTKRPAITKHLSNILKTKELVRNSVCSKMEHTATDGKKYKTNFYNLDAIISIGYRVNSAKATKFRIWATNVIRQHLKNKYSHIKKADKHTGNKFTELKNFISLIENVLQLKDLPVEAKGLAQIISEYTRALDILDDFDHEKLKIPKGRKRSKYTMTYEEAYAVIQAMKEKFKDSDIVGQEKDKSFKSSIGAIYQTFSKKDVYSTIEEKAAHLLYFVVKNHSFIDGNKRIGAALFVCFLERNSILYREDGSRIIDDNALIALTLMIASSNPKEKPMIIKVIMNLLSN